MVTTRATTSGQSAKSQGERRKQKLALLEQLLDKDKARTTVAGGSSNAELGASSEAVQHRESQNVSGGSMSPGGVASHSQSVPFSHSLRFNTTDDATSLMSGNMTFDSSWMPLSNDPVPNLAPTGSDTLPVNDARTSGPSSGSKQAAALPCSGPSPELELITALVQSGYHRHWVSSDENSQSSQQEARRDESLLSFFAGVAALSKPAINRVIYVQQNGLFGAVIENTLALGILKGAQLLFDEEGTSPFFRKDWAAESRASSSCSTTQQLSDIRSALKRSQEHRRRMKAFLEPIFQDRRQMMRNGQPVPEDLLQWMVEKTMEHEINNIEHITDMQLLLTMAAIHTTTLSATAMLYDLAMRPEVVHDIRKEIASVLETTDGVMTSHALFSMKLLDSFMRESQRFTPPFVDSFRRYVQKPITLQDGTQIPAGTFIETPSLAVLHDAAHYKDPEVFDAYRFFNLRTKDDTPDPNGFRNREQYQFVSVTKENTSFGFGKHACPGRFFAANEIKLIMARIVLQFDLRFPADVKERYPNFHFGSVSGPSPTGLVEFKRVQE